MMMKNLLLIIFLFISILAKAQQKVFNILNYGAKQDKNFKNTTAIQKTIDAAAQAGGGRVLIPDGNFITGPIFLKKSVELHLTDNAVLLGSANRLDYNGDKVMALINAYDQQNISITGNGIINGQGRELVENVLYLLGKGVITDSQWKIKRPGEKNRLPIIYFSKCSNIKVTGITLKDASSWIQNYNNCSDVLIDSMKVQSTAYWNNDGIDIVDSRNVKITNSFFNAADDGICLKSESATGVCENIVVENCTIRSSASGFKLGTGSIGAFKHIKVNHLTVYDTYRSAIALESVDGSILEDVDIRNVTATNTGNAIFLRLGHRNKDEKYSTLKHVYIGNVKAEIPSGKPDIGYPMEGPPPKVPPHNLVPASITGLPGHEVEDVVLENIEISYGGGAKKEVAYISLDNLNTVPEQTEGYPEFTMFGELPAWGLYVRHAKGITINNFKISYLADDFRPACIFDDVQNLQINTLKVPTVKTLPVLVLNNVSKPSLKNIESPQKEDKKAIEVRGNAAH